MLKKAFQLLKYNPISRVAVYGCMNPVIGVILSVLLLHEKDQASGARSALALILVSIGIYIVNGISENRRIEDECISNIEKG
jgi:drug/metabolite transporter (DMT)-like permease